MPNISIYGIGVPTPAGSFIDDAWVEYKGSRTEQVPPGEPFKIIAHGFANIPGQTTGSEILFTAKSDDGTITQYDLTRPVFGGPIYETPNMHLKFNKNGAQVDPVMPNKNITLRITLWGNDHIGLALPPTSQW